MPRLPGCLFEFIHMQPPVQARATTRGVSKRRSWKFLTKFTRKTPVLNSFLKNLLKKENLAQLFSCEFYKISKNTFFTEHLLQSWRLLLLFIDLSLTLTFLSSVCASCRYFILSVSVLQLSYFYNSCSYLSSLLFVIPKTEFVSSFVLTSPFPSECRLLLDCVIDQKVRDIILEAILSPSERYQNIQDNPEHNSILPSGAAEEGSCWGCSPSSTFC